METHALGNVRWRQNSCFVGRREEKLQKTQPEPAFGWILNREPAFGWDASFLLTVEVFLLTVRLFCLRWGNCKQKRPDAIFRTGGTVSKKDQT